MEHEEKEKKKISVSVDPEVSDSQLYRHFLVTSSEDGIRIDFAQTEETEKEISVKVKESIAISSDAMLKFAADIVSELINYENKYHNGKGLSIPQQE